MEAQLSFTKTQINKEFLIRVWLPGESKSQLAGVSTFIGIVGIEHANKMLERAMRIRNEDKCICRLRKGVQVDFVNH